jgi:hypothetical protein
MLSQMEKMWRNLHWNWHLWNWQLLRLNFSPFPRVLFFSLLPHSFKFESHLKRPILALKPLHLIIFNRSTQKCSSSTYFHLFSPI